MRPDVGAVAARWALGEDAGRALAALDLWGPDGARPGAGPVLGAIAASTTGRYALGALARLAEQETSAWLACAEDLSQVTRLAVVAGASDALGDLLVRDEVARDVLGGELDARDAAAVCAEAQTALADAADAPAALATYQRLGLLRIAARDLLGLADTAQVGHELADLAEGILDAATLHLGGHEVGLVVIGMGKLGGTELNYVSDVDLVFATDGDVAASTRAASQLLRLVGGSTPVGRCYELDVNLRPEGRDGPLVRSLDSFRAYYERWAKTWEFQALLKARPVGGDRGVGAAFMALIDPFVWPDRLQGSRVDEIQQMKGRVEDSKSVQRDGARELKLAPGGLRDIEFAVQLLQLVHGRHDPSLRSGSTLDALDALARGGYVGESDARGFADAYRFLRTIEHRLQLLRLRRTHTVPEADSERMRIARATGLADDPESTALEQFDREYLRVQGQVRTLHEKLFFRPLLARFAEVGGADVWADHGGGLDEKAAKERLVALGFGHPQGALAHLDALARGVTRRAQLLRVLLPAILPTLAASPDPDQGLASFRSLADKLGDSPAFLKTLRDTPPVGELLATVLGASKVAGQWLERQPDVIATLASGRALGEASTPASHRRRAAALVKRAGDPDEASDGLRRMRRREAARIAVRDLGGMADVTQVAGELTGMAEGCLEAAVGLVVPSEVPMAVIAMGKLGASELGYTSDLDLLLVFSSSDERTEALRAAEQLVALLGEITPEGQAFRIDLGLRPEGRDGPLARTLGSYRTYYERWAATWELQALTQARPVAGDTELGAAFAQLARLHVYPARPDPARLADVRKMKARVERERTAPAVRSRVGRPARPARPGRAERTHEDPGRRSTYGYGYPVPGTGVESWAAARPTRPEVREGQRVDVKLGPGGLADVEWTVQLLQLAHGHEHQALQVPGTLAGLDALAEAGLVRAQDAGWLREGWTLASQLRNALYLAGARDTSVLPSGPLLGHVARMVGMGGGGAQALMDRVARTMRRVRKVHERLFYDV